MRKFCSVMVVLLLLFCASGCNQVLEVPPEAGTWLAIEPQRDTVLSGESLFLDAAFGMTNYGYGWEYLEVGVETEDFTVFTSCPSPLGKGSYTEDDFYVSYEKEKELRKKERSEISPSELPFSFHIILLPKEEISSFSGSIKIEIFDKGGSVWRYLYYYGDVASICFSTKSLEDAKAVWEAQQGA